MKQSENSSRRSAGKKTKRSSVAFVFSAEHAGNRIPRRYRDLFQSQQSVLDSHRGWDPGSKEMGRIFEQQFQTPLIDNEVSRLLIEVNRSLHHGSLFSEFSKDLDLVSQQHLINEYYLPHRQRVESAIEQHVENDRIVVHVGMHSFTPILNGIQRHADVGILYDPRRSNEAQLGKAWQTQIRNSESELRVRRNYPYRGAADGLTTFLRKRFPNDQYLGMELEVNQAIYHDSTSRWKQTSQVLAKALTAAAKQLFDVS